MFSVAPKLRMGLSMTKHSLFPMIKGHKSLNKATRIFVFASIYYSTYYDFTTILCSFVYKLFNFHFRLTLRWPTRLKCQNLCKRGRDQSNQSSTSCPFHSIFLWFSSFKMVSSVFSVHKYYFELFSLEPVRFSLSFETFFWRLIAMLEPQTRSITVTDCFETVFV